MKYKEIKFLVLCLAIVVIAFILLFGHKIYIETYCTSEFTIQRNSKDWICSTSAVKCEEYIESRLGYPCYLVFGSNGNNNHIWNMVIIDDTPHEFESNCLQFQKVSDKYNIHDIRHGFYIDGIEQNYSYQLENWQDLENKL